MTTATRPDRSKRSLTGTSAAEFTLYASADCIGHLRRTGHRTIEPTEDGQRDWTAVLDRTSAPLLRRHVRNYMTHSNADGTRYFIPYAGGLKNYVKLADEIAADGYRGFALGR